MHVKYSQERQVNMAYEVHGIDTKYAKPCCPAKVCFVTARLPLPLQQNHDRCFLFRNAPVFCLHARKEEIYAAAPLSV